MGLPPTEQVPPLSPQGAKALDRLVNGFVLAMTNGYTGDVQADVGISFLRFFVKRNIKSMSQAAMACDISLQISSRPKTILWCPFDFQIHGPVDNVLVFLVQLRQISEEGAA